MDNHAKSRRQSGMIAFCGLTVALSVALMMVGGLIPVATYCVPMLSGVLLLPIFLEFGRTTALTAYIATSLIALLIGADKEAAFFYIFFGYYPVLKWQIEKLRSNLVRLLLKLAFFLLSFCVMYGFLYYVLRLDVVMQDFAEMNAILFAVFATVMMFCMMLYDRLMLPLALIYLNKFQPKLKFLKR